MEEREVEQTINEIRRLAACVIQEFRPISGIQFGYNYESVEWVEGFIERERERRGLSNDVPEGLVNALGSFLGECIVAATDGKWEWSEDQQDWGIRFKVGGMAFPFAKVWKQFAYGRERGESVTSFYRVAVEHVAMGRLGSE